MSAYEDQLHAIVTQGHYAAPSMTDLRIAFEGLRRTMTLLAESPGWTGKAADAASEHWMSLRDHFAKVAADAAEVERLVTAANKSLERARSAYESLNPVHVPSFVRDAAAAADAGAMIAVPGLRGMHPASSVVGIFENMLNAGREREAEAAVRLLHEELQVNAGELEQVSFGFDFRKIDDTGGTGGTGNTGNTGNTGRTGGTGGTGGTGRSGGGGYTPSYPTPSSFGITDPTYDPSWQDLSGPPHDISVDDGGGGTIPTHGGPGVISDNFGNRPGGGSSAGTTAAVLGGATAAGGAALRFGMGGFGGGRGLAAGAPGAGTGGLLSGSGSSGAGAAGAGRLGTSGSGGAGAGASAAGGRGGMMGHAPMGARGGAGGSKDKKPGLGGHIAPKLEDDEAEFRPLGDGARAGGREGSRGADSSWD